MRILTPRPRADDAVSPHLLSGTDRDVLVDAILCRMGCSLSAWHQARLAKLLRKFADLEGCAARPSPSEWR